MMAQVSALVSPEVAQQFVWWVVAGLGTLLIGTVGFVAKRAWGAGTDWLRGLKESLRVCEHGIEEVRGETRRITQELVGFDGKNGLRGDVRELKRGHVRFDRELERVCAKLDVEREDG